jgi:hypothetical protein
MFISLSILQPLGLCHTGWPHHSALPQTPQTPPHAQMMGASVALEALKERITCQCHQKNYDFSVVLPVAYLQYLPSYPGLLIGRKEERKKNIIQGGRVR